MPTVFDQNASEVEDFVTYKPSSGSTPSSKNQSALGTTSPTTLFVAAFHSQPKSLPIWRKASCIHWTRGMPVGPRRCCGNIVASRTALWAQTIPLAVQFEIERSCPRPDC